MQWDMERSEIRTSCVCECVCVINVNFTDESALIFSRFLTVWIHNNRVEDKFLFYTKINSSFDLIEWKFI